MQAFLVDTTSTLRPGLVVEADALRITRNNAVFHGVRSIIADMGQDTDKGRERAAEMAEDFTRTLTENNNVMVFSLPDWAMDIHNGSN